MIYIAGKSECTAAEMCAAEQAQEIVCNIVSDDIRIGHSLGGDSTLRDDFMQEAYKKIEESNAVIFLPDWRKHKATQIQHMHCRFIGKRIMYFKITAAGAVLTLPRRKKRSVKNGKH